MSRWATFDCYGTLIDWNTGIGGVLEQLYGAEQAPTLLRRYHELEPEIQSEAYRTYKEVLALTLERLANEVGYGIPEGEGGVLAQSLPDWPPYPEVPKALEELRRRGWSLAILSNIDHALMVESEKRLGVPFDLIVTAEDVRSYKPAPGHWERFFETTTADKERHVHVGASAFHDVAPGEGARAEDGVDQPRRRRLLRAHGRRGTRSRAAGSLRPARRARRARAGVTLRPPRDDEFDAMLELMNAHQLAAFGEADYTADDLRTWLTTPYVEVDRDLRVLERDGRLIGYADADPTRNEPPLWWCDVKVAPDVDARAVVAELVAWLEQRAVEGRLRVWTSEDDARIVGAFDALGFEPVRHSYRMEIDLDDELREPVWPAEISVRTATADDQRSVYDAVVEVWQDTNDPIDETFEEWAHWHVERDSFDPALWLLVFDGDEFAGFSICRSDPVDPQAGHVNLLGVRRAWRRQGLGEALLLRSFDAFRQRGLTRVTLGVDASSVTGATRLYERAGMRVYRDTVFLERAVRE